MHQQEPVSGGFAVFGAVVVVLLGVLMALSELWIDPSNPPYTRRPPLMPWQRRVLAVGCILIGCRVWVIGRRILVQERTRDDEIV